MIILKQIIKKYLDRRLIRQAQFIAKNNNVKFTNLNTGDAAIFLEIFHQREYATMFPFYEDATIVDIGAHKGYFALFAERYTGNNSKIFSFEPTPSTYKDLQLNLQKNNAKKVGTFNLGIAEKEGAFDYYCSYNQNNSLFPDVINAHSLSIKEKITITAITLEDVFKKCNIDRIDFLKMDCEGAEYPILLNAPAHILEKIDTISLEYHDTRTYKMHVRFLLKHLEDSGFKQIKISYQNTHSNIHLGKLVVTRL